MVDDRLLPAACPAGFAMTEWVSSRGSFSKMTLSMGPGTLPPFGCRVHRSPDPLIVVVHACQASHAVRCKAAVATHTLCSPPSHCNSTQARMRPWP